MDRRTIEAQELEEKTQDPAFWADPKAAEATMKKVREVKGWLNGYKEAEDAGNDLAVLVHFLLGGFAFLGEIEQHGQVVVGILGLRVTVEPAFHLAHLLHGRFGGFRVAPKLRILGLFI